MCGVYSGGRLLAVVVMMCWRVANVGGEVLGSGVGGYGCGVVLARLQFMRYGRGERKIEREYLFYNFFEKKMAKPI